MRKYALFGLIAVLSFGFVGCASSLEKNWGLKEEGDGYVSCLEVELGDRDREPWCVTVVYCGKQGKARVSLEVYEKLVVGHSVKLKLACAIMKNESDVKGERFCDATYWWWTPNVTDEYRIITFRMP